MKLVMIMMVHVVLQIDILITGVIVPIQRYII